jgi:hypothetical protein
MKYLKAVALVFVITLFASCQNNVDTTSDFSNDSTTTIVDSNFIKFDSCVIDTSKH